MGFRATVGGAAIISALRDCASASSSGMSFASGRFRQYRLGISARISAGLARAGLKVAR
jgi:hypothetical protein